jgi:hypothetical protein
VVRRRRGCFGSRASFVVARRGRGARRALLDETIAPAASASVRTSTTTPMSRIFFFGRRAGAASAAGSAITADIEAPFAPRRAIDRAGRRIALVRGKLSKPALGGKRR